MVLGKLPVPGRPTNLVFSRVKAYCACSRCRWGVVWTFSSLVYHFSFLSPSLWETARYRPHRSMSQTLISMCKLLKLLKILYSYVFFFFFCFFFFCFFFLQNLDTELFDMWLETLLDVVVIVVMLFYVHGKHQSHVGTVR